MAVARDLVGISVPFAAGVATGASLYPLLPSFQSLVLWASFLCCLTGVSALSLLRLGHNFSRSRILFRIAAAFFLTGLFCSLQPALTAGFPDNGGGYLSRAAFSAAQRLKARIDSIPFPNSSTGALVKALLTGDRSGLSKKTTDVFRASGASHILALSGLHLGIIYLILCKMAIPLGNGPRARRIRSALVVGFCGFYTMMTGASPSIVRAFIFIAFAEGLGLLGRKREAANVLLAALTVQLALKPEVIGSLGFQLSYLAMAGVIFIYPELERLYPESGSAGWDRADPVRKIWKGAAMSISCQLTTAPLVWLRFRTFPQYFIVTNLIALPMTSAVMVLSVTTTALSSFGFCPQRLVWLNDAAVQSLVWCLEIISGLSAPLPT